MVTLTKEGAGVLSTVTRHLAFLDSELVERAISSTSFDPAMLRRPGTTLFIEIPPELLEAQRGLLRCWVSTLVKTVSKGSETKGEVLCLLDEASALGGLPALEEALVRGRSSGVRLLLAYQSDSQVASAFKDKPDLIYSNCSSHVYLGGINDYACAERLSKRIGDATIVTESAGTSRSRQHGDQGNSSAQFSSSRNWAEVGRPLLRPEELMVMDSDLLIAFLKDTPPILARRIKWYLDPLFKRRWFMPERFKRRVGWLLFLIGLALFIAMLAEQMK